MYTWFENHNQRFLYQIGSSWMPENTILGSLLVQKIINDLDKVMEKMFINLSTFDDIANIQDDKNKTQFNLAWDMFEILFYTEWNLTERSKTGHLSDKTQMFQYRITPWLVAVLLQKIMGYSLVINWIWAVWHIAIKETETILSSFISKSWWLVSFILF